MRTQHTRQHPCDQLVQGPADFWEALQLVEAQGEGERAIMRRAGAPAEEMERMDASYAPIGAATTRARRVWLEEQEATRLRTIDRLRADALAAEAALDDEASRWLGLLAEALEDGDYSRLAI